MTRDEQSLLLAPAEGKYVADPTIPSQPQDLLVKHGLACRFDSTWADRILDIVRRPLCRAGNTASRGTKCAGGRKQSLL